MPHEHRARFAERDRPKLNDIDRAEGVSERRKVERDRRSQLLCDNGDTGAGRATDACQRQLTESGVESTLCLQIYGRRRARELAAPKSRELTIECRRPDRFESDRARRHQRAELNASTKVLVAIRSAKRISSDGAIAMITLPMRSTEAVASGRRG